MMLLSHMSRTLHSRYTDYLKQNLELIALVFHLPTLNHMESVQSLSLLTQQLTIYIGLPALLFGFIGCCLTVVVFLSLRTFRENSCAFYLIVLTISNIVQLLSGILPRILNVGFFINFSFSSFYCKTRIFFSSSSALISVTCLCLAILDQYAATSHRPSWHRFSDVKIARRLTIFFTIMWFLQAVPLLIYLDNYPSPLTSPACTTIEPNYTKYRTYVVGIAFNGVLPLLVSGIFGILAYINVRDIAYRTVPLVRRELDKQLTTMALAHVVLHIITGTPYFFIIVLISNSQSSTDQLTIARIHFAYSVTIIIIIFDFAVILDLRVN